MANMTLKDREQLRRWLAGGASLKEVEEAERIGAVGNERFTPAAVRAYKLIWTWSTSRFHGAPGRAQDRYYSKRGSAAMQRRIDRCRDYAARLAKGE